MLESDQRIAELERKMEAIYTRFMMADPSSTRKIDVSNILGAVAIRGGVVLYSAASNPAAIANTATETAFARSFTLAANTLFTAGTILELEASGRFSTTGTPTLVFKFKIGTLIVATFSFTTGAGVTNDAWSLKASVGVKTPGAGGILLIGPSIGIIGGFSGTNVAAASSTVGAQGLDTNENKAVTLTAQWGAASASNTVTMDNFVVKVIYPGETQ